MPWYFFKAATYRCKSFNKKHCLFWFEQRNNGILIASHPDRLPNPILDSRGNIIPHPDYQGVDGIMALVDGCGIYKYSHYLALHTHSAWHIPEFRNGLPRTPTDESPPKDRANWAILMLLLFKHWRSPGDWIPQEWRDEVQSLTSAEAALDVLYDKVWKYYLNWKTQLETVAESSMPAHMFKTPDLFWAREILPRIRMSGCFCYMLTALENSDTKDGNPHVHDVGSKI